MGHKPKQVKLYCPVCDCEQPVRAMMTHLECYNADVVAEKNAQGDFVHIDWPNADVSGDFVYVCAECEEPLASDLNEIEDALKSRKD